MTNGLHPSSENRMRSQVAVREELVLGGNGLQARLRTIEFRERDLCVDLRQLVMMRHMRRLLVGTLVAETARMLSM
jgi:hypothetical protein